MEDRQYWLDSLRGLAALQVVLLHYISALFPVAAGGAGISHTAYDAAFRSSPFFFFIDGNTAVYLFFLISGYVLGPAFSRRASPLPRLALSRLIRLALPVLASAPVAVLGLVGWHYWSQQVLSNTGSHWLAALVKTPLEPLTIGQDILLNGTILGYRGASVFGSAEWLTPIAHALNPPLWTLAYEMWGSLLLVCICVLPITPLWRGAVALLLILFVTGSGELSLFLIGYVASLLRLPQSRAKPILWVLSAAMASIGVFFAVTKEFALLQRLDTLWAQMTLFSAQSEFHLASSFGAVLLFLAIWITPEAKRVLSTSALQSLGRLSFSFYLLHFPIMLLVGLPAALLTMAVAPYVLSAFLGIAVGIAVTFALASFFYRVDRYALALARRVR